MLEGIEQALELLSRGVENAKIEADSENLEDSSVSLKFIDIDEWADELALLNKQRNKIEAKLRDIVLRFIQFDFLMDKNKGTVCDRVLSSIPTNQRNKFKGLEAGEVIQKYTWLELISLIRKEWKVFDKFFIDKSALTLNSDIINDRLDAHAKSADKADIALQRRSLNWFEEKLRNLQ